MSKKTIFLVDDHEVVRLGLRTLLSHQEEFEVIGEAGTAKEAITKIDRQQPDIVLMDIRLPGTSGIDACEEIVSNHPIFVSLC